MYFSRSSRYGLVVSFYKPEQIAREKERGAIEASF